MMSTSSSSSSSSSLSYNLDDDYFYVPTYEINRDATEGLTHYVVGCLCCTVCCLVAFFLLNRINPSSSSSNDIKKARAHSNMIQLFLLCFILFAHRTSYLKDWFGLEGVAGCLTGYECFGLIGELMGIQHGGKVRPSMTLHHLGCCVMSTLSAMYYFSIPLKERQYWWILFESMQYFFDSSIVLLIRNMSPTKPGFKMNVAFACSFYYSRFYRQYYLWTDAFRTSTFTFDDLRQGYLPWSNTITTVVYGCYACFMILNVYWGIEILKMGLGIKRKNKKKKKKEEEKSA